MKLTKILEQVISEIGDTVMDPSNLDLVINDETQRIYNYETKQGTYYEIDLKEQEPEPFTPDPFNPDKFAGVNLYVTFGITNESGEKSLSVVSNKGELYEVMAAVVAAIKDDIKNNPYIKTISFEPSKRDKTNRDSDISNNARANLYKRYLQQNLNLSQTDIIEDGNLITANLSNYRKKI